MQSLIAAVAAIAMTFAPTFGLTPTPARKVTLPPTLGKTDYQLGKPYEPAAGVTIVARDRSVRPAPGLYNICYINGFQTQDHEMDFWLTRHPNLILKDRAGREIGDPNWPGERILDVSTPRKRGELARILMGWVDGCAKSGFDAVEFDNMDIFTREGKGYITKGHVLSVLRPVVRFAHSRGLAVGQKNTVEFGTSGRDIGLDYVIAESCQEWNECGEYTKVYGTRVIDIEYDTKWFGPACGQWGKHHSVVLRDRLLSAPRDDEGQPNPSYQVGWCQ